MDAQKLADLLLVKPKASEFADKIFNDHFNIDHFEDYPLIIRDFKHHKKICIENIVYEIAVWCLNVTGTFAEYLNEKKNIGGIDFYDVLYIKSERELYHAVYGKTEYDIPDEVVLEYIIIRNQIDCHINSL
jgi:hypothetical protein